MRGLVSSSTGKSGGWLVAPLLALNAPSAVVESLYEEFGVEHIKRMNLSHEELEQRACDRALSLGWDNWRLWASDFASTCSRALVIINRELVDGEVKEKLTFCRKKEPWLARQLEANLGKYRVYSFNRALDPQVVRVWRLLDHEGENYSRTNYEEMHRLAASLEAARFALRITLV